MFYTRLRRLALAFFCLFPVTAQEIAYKVIQAPTKNPPVITASETKAKKTSSPAKAADGGAYSIGDPSDEAQLFLELINRARKDPLAEAARLINTDNPEIQAAIGQFHVDTNLMVQQFGLYSSRPPLSMNAQLTAAARDHSQYMLDQGVQEHEEHFGDITIFLGQRLEAHGYQFYTGSENVYAYMDNVVQGHAGFEVDWGSGAGTFGGMQRPPGHRHNVHDKAQHVDDAGNPGPLTDSPKSEVGIYVLNGVNQVGSNYPVGPKLVTQEFGEPRTPTFFLTGVAYYDINGNNFYDIGEGLAGVTVTIDGITSSYAVTTNSGGYSIPLPAFAADSLLTVHFQVPGMDDAVRSVSIVGTNNTKLDFTPTFVPATIVNKPASVVAFTGNPINVAPLPGATGYKARYLTVKKPPVENGDSSTNVSFTINGPYNPVPSFGISGKTFHFLHCSITNGTSVSVYPQSMEFKTPYSIKQGAELRFKSRLGYAASGESTKIEISVDEGATWTSIFRQQGVPGNPVDATTVSRTNNLSAFAGQVALFRFTYDVVGQYYQFTGANGQEGAFGWFLDDITFVNADQVTNMTTTDFGTDAVYNFTPPGIGSHFLQFRAVNFARLYPWGVVQTVNAGTADAQPITVTQVGSGTITPNYNGQTLTVGTSYTMTANPATGFMFTGWTGSSNTPSKALTFVMRSDLSFTATFVDTNAPVIAIAAPLNNAHSPVPNVLVSGTATDNDVLKSIEIRREDSTGTTAPMTPTGLANWALNLQLAPGPNKIYVRATDQTGNSRESSVTVFYDQTAKIGLSIVGNGTVTPPGITTSNLLVGSAVTINAVPATGYRFAGWTGSAVQDAAALTFTMQTNVNFTATFVDNAGPTVSITSPASTTNANYKAQGTAIDNEGVQKVEVRVGAGDYFPADGTGSWSLEVPLNEGANTITVRALDINNLVSSEVTKIVVYSKLVPFNITQIGLGTISPDLSKSNLVNGNKYTVNARPAVGFTFGGWVTNSPTASGTNKNPRLTFTVANGLSVEAVFIDTTAPTLTVTAPTPNLRTTNAVLTLKGTVKDNDMVTAIRYQLNGEWNDIAPTANWLATTTLVPGPNSIKLYAEDRSGKRSKTNSLTVTYVQMAGFAATTDGHGTVSPKLAANLEVGKSFSISALPAVGFVFDRWEGTLASTNAKLTFTMTTAGFTNKAFFRDNTAPKIAIASPTANQKVTNETVIIRGTASDNVGVAGVKLRFNGGEWHDAVGTTSWSYSIASTNLGKGIFKVDAYAFDAIGKVSPLSSVTFTIPSYEGIYFGTFTSAHIKGVVGVMVRANQEALILAGDSRTNSAAADLFEELPVNTAGVFDFGKFTPTAVSGKIPVTPLELGSFTAAKAPLTGARAADVGLYEGFATNDGGVFGQLYALISADGGLLIAASNLVTTASSANKGTLTSFPTTGLVVGTFTFKGGLTNHILSGVVLSKKVVIGSFNLSRSLGITGGLGAISAGDEATEVLVAKTTTYPTMDAWIENGAVTIWFSTEPGRSYTLQQSTDLQNWSEVATFTAETSAYERKTTATEAHSFFRLLAH